MRLTATQQRNGVSEGMALGLVLCDRSSLIFDKVAIDLSFVGAWRSWPYRSRFPQVDTDMSHGLDGTRAMTRADVRKQTWNLYWDASGGHVTVRPRRQWEDGRIEADAVASSIAGDLPAVEWKRLARDLLERLDR